MTYYLLVEGLDDEKREAFDAELTSLTPRRQRGGANGGALALMALMQQANASGGELRR